MNIFLLLLILWPVCGFVGWIIGTISDAIIYKRKPDLYALFICVILGPTTLGCLAVISFRHLFQKR